MLGDGTEESAVTEKFEYTPLEDEMLMDESDDDTPDAQALAVRGHRNVLQPYARGGTEVRTFSAFAESYSLSEYMDYAHNSELRRHDRQAIFMHFVSVTGPTMSLYERETSRDPSIAFDSDAPLDSNLWSCRYSPTLSLCTYAELLHRHFSVIILSPSWPISRNNGYC